jgi:hypothetical protein
MQAPSVHAFQVEAAEAALLDLRAVFHELRLEQPVFRRRRDRARIPSAHESQGHAQPEPPAVCFT